MTLNDHHALIRFHLNDVFAALRPEDRAALAELITLDMAAHIGHHVLPHIPGPLPADSRN